MHTRPRDSAVEWSVLFRPDFNPSICRNSSSWVNCWKQAGIEPGTLLTRGQCFTTEPRHSLIWSMTLKDWKTSYNILMYIVSYSENVILQLHCNYKCLSLIFNHEVQCVIEWSTHEGQWTMFIIGSNILLGWR